MPLMTMADLFNPYLDAIETWFDPTPPNHPDTCEIDKQELINLRQNLVGAFSWGIPDRQALGVIGDAGPVIELGANTGYWSWCLRQLGYDVVAVDPEQPRSNRRYTEILSENGEAIISEYADHTLFLCWISYPSSWALEAVQQYEKAGGDRICAVMCDWRDYTEQSYPGSWMEYLHHNWQDAGTTDIPQWPQATDYLSVFTNY